MKLSKNYEPGAYEKDIYDLWEKAEAFKPAGKGESYSIVMPPPNANANLHIGYELTAALEDIAARYHRLRGDKTLLLPGADHAGFETWVVYEKKLAAEGKSRFDFPREVLYQQVWDFVANNRANFTAQMRRMGVSCDWSRFTFTLDDKIVRRAYDTFHKMWDDGLIYRGERLVNYCTFHGTGFADIEVAYKDEKSKLWYLDYPLADGSGSLTIATTRPETMFGDTAVAVNPTDKRYAKYIGKTVKLPLSNREIPVIADDFVDPTFGTGAVKITPAHDPNDFEAGERHKLPKISVIDYDGKLNDNAPEEFRGLDVKEARAKVVALLAEQGILAKEENYDHSVGHCYKCGTIIQPLLKDQWFVNMQPLAKRAIEALEQGKITFYPEAKQQQLVNYLKNLRDWNISRQIAWGIPIPAFVNTDDPTDWIYDERVDQEIITVGDQAYRRDSDVFDTWFSSSSWPYATLDFPDGQDFKDFYPLSLMETGGEILQPWVSRMIMLGLYNTGEIPFKSVYIHGYVMAEDGSKMSKSVGNVVDPLPVIDEFGSDALRLGIIVGRSPAVNRGYDKRKVIDGRNFCNKLWNIARYTEDIIGDNYHERASKPTTSADYWVLDRLASTSRTISDHLDNYRFSEAYDALYHFVWDDFADWYIEASKTAQNKPVLAYCLESILQLAHPFAPFVTETIWQTLVWEPHSLLATSSWPTDLPSYGDKAKDFEEIKQIVTEARAIIRATGAGKVTLGYDRDKLLESNASLITRLAGLKLTEQSETRTGVNLVQTSHECWLDIDAETLKNYAEKLADQRYSAENDIVQLKSRLANKSYVANAPKTVVDQTRDQLEVAISALENIETEQKRFDA